MGNISLKEFKPTILFLVKFLGIYLVGNFLYGLYVTAYEPRPDPMTHVVSGQTAVILSACGWATDIQDEPNKANTRMVFEGNNILAVYEGCNGINVMIIFAAFVLSFGPLSKPVLWFIPVGLLIIHLMNLLRIGVLFFVAVYMKEYLYFAHKYFFTAILYAVVFALWLWWVKRYASKKPATA
jgi:exosortase family protein XrtF